MSSVTYERINKDLMTFMVDQALKVYLISLGNSKGVAFIRYDQRYEAETAIKKLNNYTPPNGTEPITVKLANTPFNINNSCNMQSTVASNGNTEFINGNPTGPLPSNNNIRGIIPNIRPNGSSCSEMLPRMDVVLPNNGAQTNGMLNSEYVQSTVPNLPPSHQIPFPPGQIVCMPQMHSIATFPMR